MSNIFGGNLELVFAYGQEFLIPKGDRVIGNILRDTGEFQTDEIERVSVYLDELQEFKSSRCIFVDIGANIGTHTIAALKYYRYKRGVALEPSLKNYRLLTANICLQGLSERTFCINAAASDQEGIANLFHNNENCGDYRMENNPGENTEMQSSFEKITVVNIKDLLRGQLEKTSLHDVLCWIDTQGHELQILKGIKSFVEGGMPTVFEFWPYGIEKQNGCCEDLLEILNVQGLQIAEVAKESIRLINKVELKQLWKQLRESETEVPEGASFSNILIYKLEPMSEISAKKGQDSRGKFFSTIKSKIKNLASKK